MTIADCRKLLGSMILAVAAATGASSFSAGLLYAQEPNRESELQSILAQAANRRWFVRVVASEEDTVVGNILRTSSSSVRVADLELQIQHIRTLERRVFESSGTRSGALIGGTTLGILGSLFAIGFCGIGDGGCNEGGALAVGAAGGAMIGARQLDIGRDVRTEGYPRVLCGRRSLSPKQWQGSVQAAPKLGGRPGSVPYCV